MTDLQGRWQGWRWWFLLLLHYYYDYCNGDDNDDEGTYNADDKDGDDDPLPVARLWIGSNQLLRRKNVNIFCLRKKLLTFLIIKTYAGSIKQ